MEVLVGEREILETEIDKIIFINHSSVAFDLIRANNVYKYKYSNGEYLVDRLCVAFKESLLKKDEYIYYYRRLIFDALTIWYSDKRPKKFSEIFKDFENHINIVEDREGKKILKCLIDELGLFKKNCDKNIVLNRDLKTLMNDYGINSNFPCIVEKKDSLFYRPLRAEKSTRKDIITLDHSFKTARDDAISISKTHNGYILCIYISDVASYVGVDTVLYTEAFKRGASIYPKADICSYVPMFPSKITQELFSLNSGTSKMAIEHRFKISNDFNIVACKIRRVRINVAANYSFDSIEKLEKDDPTYDSIELLSKLTDGLKSHFNLDYHVSKERNETIIRNAKKLDSVGSKIITITTLLLNSYIAEVMSMQKYPFIYRINDTSLSDKNFNGSIYSVDDLGHVVNNGNCYGHVATPVRNFASLLNQYFELNLLVDPRPDKEKFIRKWYLNLPKIVNDLNIVLALNSEFRDAVETIFGRPQLIFGGNQLTKK